MRRNGMIRIVAVLALVSLIAIACDEETGPSGTSEEIPDEFVLGGVYTLSGPAAFLGVLERAGVRLAIEQFEKGECIVEMIPPQPCDGGGLKIGNKTVEIEFRTYDDQSDSRLAIDQVTRLIERDDATVVWGPRMNEAVVSAASILEPQQIIEVCSICSSPAMTIGREFGFDITDTGVLEKHAMAQFLLEDPATLEENNIPSDLFDGRTKTAIIGREELYVIHGAEGWAEFINQEGSPYEEFDVDRDLVTYPFGTTDFAPFVQRLAELDPDIVLMDVYVTPDMIAIMQEMLNQGLDFETGEIILLGNDVLMLAPVVEAAKAEGMNMSSGYVWGWQEQNPGIENPELAGLFDRETLDRIETYTDRYNTFFEGNEDALALGPFARGTYDAAMWLFFAIEKAQSLDPEEIAEAWKDSRFNGLRGPDQGFFVRPDTDETTGQLFVPEYIMGVRKSAPFYTGIKYEDEIYVGPWVFGDELPE